MTKKFSSTFRLSLIWHTSGTLGLLIIASSLFGLPPWRMPIDNLLPILSVIAGYPISSWILSRQRKNGATISVKKTALVTLGVYLVIYPVVLSAVGRYPAKEILSVLGGAIALNILFFAINYLRVPLTATIIGGAIAAITASLVPYTAEDMYTLYPQDVETYISTAFYNVKITRHKTHIPIPKPVITGGGIARISDQYMLVNGDGEFRRFSWSEDTGKLQSTPLPFVVPVNREEYQAENKDTKHVHKKLRVTDVLVAEDGEIGRVFVAYHHWHSDQKCIAIRIAMLADTTAAILDGSSEAQWQQIFETTPCLSFETKKFNGQMAGGRLSLLDQDTLLFTVGDHDFRDDTGKPMFAQNKDASYGKILAIDISTGISNIVSLGHRNPQGLHISSNGDIWATEHGAEGGDELNLIIANENYGWPEVTHGTDYGSDVWLFNAYQGQHLGYRAPIFSWVPSIGISAITKIEKSAFPYWKNNLLVSSLERRTIYRVVIQDGHAVVTEPMWIDARIRDIIEGNDGRIILWTDSGDIVTLQPADESSSGKLLFESRCGGCHNIFDGSNHGIGPDLFQIYGQAVASKKGYAYSAALQNVRGRWTSETLDSFMAKPNAFAPGTEMQIEPISDPEHRKSIIRYLRKGE